MLFRVSPNSPVPIYRQLVQQVREAVVCGRLTPGDRLPSLREVASRLVINHLTVKQAYQILEQEGLIETLRGRGTFVRSEATAALRRRVGEDLDQRLRELAAGAGRAGLSRERFLEMAREAWETSEQAP